MKYKTLIILATLTVHTVVTTPPHLALIQAAKSCQALDVSQLLQQGVSPDATDVRNKTALSYAAKQYGSQGRNSPHKGAFMVNALLRASSSVRIDDVHTALHTGNAALIKAVITAFHKTSGTTFCKQDYLRRTQHSKNLKVLTAGLETGILKPTDITNETIKNFLMHADAVSARTVQKVKKKVKQTVPVTKKNQAASEELLDTDEGATCCPICKDSLDDADSMALECAHTFHTSCMEQWIPHSSTCPSCRRPTTLSRYGSVDFIRQ